MSVKKIIAFLSAVTITFGSVVVPLERTGIFDRGFVTLFNADAADLSVDADSLPVSEPVLVASDPKTENGWKYDILGSVVRILKYEGTDTEVTVPSSIEDMPVNQFSSKVFADCPNVTKVTIPNTIIVTQQGYPLDGSNIETVVFEDGIAGIPNYICYKATQLKTIVFPESSDAENFSIGKNAFGNTAISSVEIPDYVTEIKDNAFADCPNIVSVDLGNVVKLGDAVFSGCTGLKEITVPNTLTGTSGSIGIFSGSGIETVIFEDGMDCIPAYICKNASSLKNIVFPEKISGDTFFIGHNAFENTAVESLVIPDYVTEIRQSAFADCHKLSSLDLGKVSKLNTESFARCENLRSVTIPNTIQPMPMSYINSDYIKGPFDESGLETVTFEDGFERIPDGICRNATKLKTIVYPEKRAGDSLTIGDNAFRNTAVDSVVIPDVITAVGSYAFADNENITSADLNNVTRLGASIFKNCTNLSEITIPNTVDETKYRAGTGPLGESCIETVIFAEGTTHIPNYICRKAENLKNVVFPENTEVLEIGEYAFSDSSIESITLPETLTEIGASAFYNCKLLKEITIPKNVVKTAKSDSADTGGPFMGSALETIIFEEGIKDIPEHICSRATNVKNVVIPENSGTEEGFVINNYAFYNTAIEEIKFPSNLTTIGGSAFIGTQLKELTVPESTKTIDWYAFKDCKQLVSAELSGVETINGSFQYCDSLEYVNMPDVKYINAAFTACKSLKEVDIPASIGENSAYLGNVSSIRVVRFADGIEKIPKQFCANMKELETVYLPDSVSEIGPGSFNNCEKLSEIKTSRDDVKFYPNSFLKCSSLNDPRFDIFDGSETLYEVNSNRLIKDNLLNFTLKYKLNKNLIVKYVDYIEIYLPKGIKYSGKYSSSNIVTEYNDSNGGGYLRFSGNYKENTIRFSSRINDADDYYVSAFIGLDSGRYDFGEVNVNSPDFTVSSVECTNTLSANVYGFAPNGADVDIYVNGVKSSTFSANKFSRKYSGIVTLPKSDSNEYEITAKCGDLECEPITITYDANCPIVESVIYNYNAHGPMVLDITDIFTKGYSPVITIAPGTPYSFSLKISNSDRVDHVFVTSQKGNDSKYIEAFYNEETDLWVTKDRFDITGVNYLPNVLNVSIIEKKDPIVLGPDYDYEDDNSLIHEDADPETNKYFQDIIDNSSVDLLYNDEQRTLAECSVSNGDFNESFNVYYGEDDGTYINGKYYTAAEVAKDPEKYGFKPLGVVTVDEDGNKTETYFRILDIDDVQSVVGDFLNANNAELNLRSVFEPNLKKAPLAAISDWSSGIALLKMGEGKNASTDGAKFANKCISGSAIASLDKLMGYDKFGPLGLFNKMTSGLADIEKFNEQWNKAGDNNDLKTLAAILFAAKLLNDLAGAELLTALLGGNWFAATLLSSGIGWALDGMSEWLDGEIERERELEKTKQYKEPGYMRHIIDPSGIVYEAVMGNPVKDVTVTIYYLDEETGEAVKWNAEDYDQINPLITDGSGYYYWDVPEGKWKVVCEKEGYETIETEWFDIPPIRTDVHMGMIDKTAPEIVSAELTDEGIEIGFSKFVDISTVTADSVILSKFDGSFDIVAKVLDEGDAYADTFVLTGKFTSAVKTVRITSDIKSYAGTDAIAAEIEIKNVSDDPDVTTTETTTTTESTTTTTTTTESTTTSTTEQTTTTASDTDTPPTTTEAPSVTIPDVEGLGDVDGDGQYTPLDASKALVQYSILSTGGERTFTDEEFARADIDGNGMIDPLDASKILGFYAYLSTTDNADPDMRKWLKMLQ